MFRHCITDMMLAQPRMHHSASQSSAGETTFKTSTGRLDSMQPMLERLHLWATRFIPSLKTNV